MTQLSNNKIALHVTLRLAATVTLAIGGWVCPASDTIAQTGHIYQPTISIPQPTISIPQAPMHVPHSPVPIYQPPIQIYQPPIHIPQPPTISHQTFTPPISHNIARDQMQHQMQHQMQRQAHEASQAIFSQQQLQRQMDNASQTMRMQEEIRRQNQNSLEAFRSQQQSQQYAHSLHMQQQSYRHNPSPTNQQRIVGEQLALAQRQAVILANNPNFFRRRQQIQEQVQLISERVATAGSPTSADLVQLRALQRQWARNVRMATWSR